MWSILSIFHGANFVKCYFARRLVDFIFVSVIEKGKYVREVQLSDIIITNEFLQTKKIAIDVIPIY